MINDELDQQTIRVLKIKITTKSTNMFSSLLLNYIYLLSYYNYSIWSYKLFF